MDPLDEIEYPLGSQKRQEKERELDALHDELAVTPLSTVNGPADPQQIPESLWRGNG